MFMTKENATQKKELTKLYKKIKAIYGYIPPQMKLLGDIDALYLQEFLASIIRIAKHPHIDFDFFTFLRLYMAYKEEYIYCKEFNTKMLISRGYDTATLKNSTKDITLIPLDTRHKALGEFAIKSMYNPQKCTQKDLDNLYDMGWLQKDVFDAVEHAGTLLRNGRILDTYLTKDI